MSVASDNTYTHTKFVIVCSFFCFSVNWAFFHVVKPQPFILFISTCPHNSRSFRTPLSTARLDGQYLDALLLAHVEFTVSEVVVAVYLGILFIRLKCERHTHSHSIRQIVSAIFRETMNLVHWSRILAHAHQPLLLSIAHKHNTIIAPKLAANTNGRMVVRMHEQLNNSDGMNVRSVCAFMVFNYIRAQVNVHMASLLTVQGAKKCLSL